MNREFSFRKVYGAAFVITVITMYGLLAGLLGDGVWDVQSWVALSIPLFVVLWKIWCAKKSSHSD